MNLTRHTAALTSEVPYLIISPEEDHPDKTPKPLIVILHGFGKSDEVYSSLPPRINKHDYHYLIPRAPFRILSDDDHMGGAWVFTRLGGDDLYGRQLSIRYLKETIQNALRLTGADSRNIILMAFSQAAFVGLSMAIREPGFFRKIILQGGWANLDIIGPQLSGGLEKMDFFIQHGSRDTAVPVSYGLELAATLAKHDGNVYYKEYDCGHFYTKEILDDSDRYIKNSSIENAVLYKYT